MAAGRVGADPRQRAGLRQVRHHPDERAAGGDPLPCSPQHSCTLTLTHSHSYTRCSPDPLRARHTHTHSHSHARTHAHTIVLTYSHTRSHAHTLIHTHTHAHTHTHEKQARYPTLDNVFTHRVFRRVHTSVPPRAHRGNSDPHPASLSSQLASHLFGAALVRGSDSLVIIASVPRCRRCSNGTASQSASRRAS